MNAILLPLQQVVFGSKRYGDIYIAALMVAIITLFVLPIPPWLLDILIAMNLTLSTVLIMMALYVSNVLAFSTFPSLLLLTTLFRLALNITSTRLILLDAYAGEIIFTFGNFVVAGNFVVGVVIFLIILVVQFIVIVKGAERVAEVSARFTLDAMPGKQMSIDADMRAGVLDIRDAQKKRSILEKENQLFGAMDGAMKFVKGDAIASMIIVAINVVAGLTIGIMQKGMAPDQALTTYSILTIGDGLVTQIPALLISITAGIITTRVTTEEKTGLGTDIVGQIFAVPKAILIAAFVVLGFALIPGFPKLEFLGLAIVLFVVGIFVNKSTAPGVKSKGKGLLPHTKHADGKEEGGEGGEEEDFSITVPLLVQVDAAVQKEVSPDDLNDNLIEVRKALYYDLGVPFPGIHLRFSDSLSGGKYQILLQEVPISEGVFRIGYLYVRETSENLKIFGIKHEPVANPPDRRPAFWVSVAQQQKLQDLQVPSMDATKLLSFHISLLLKRYSGEFIGLQETKMLLTHMEAKYGELIREVQRVLPAQKIAEVLQRLVQEDISIRNLRVIFQALIEWGAKEKDALLLTEYVRVSLKRYISYKFSGGRNVLTAYLVDPSTEEILRKSIRQTSAGSFLALDPAMSKKITDEIRKQFGDLSGQEKPPVLLASMDIRRYTRKLIELEMPAVPVLSHQELTEEINIQPLGRILVR